MRPRDDGPPHGAAPLGYASAGLERPPRDPLSYYREPPEISTWTSGELTLVLVLCGIPVIAAALFALAVWLLSGGPFR